VIDSHCHLADEAFKDDLEAVVERAKTAGIEGALVILEAGNGKEAAQAERLEHLWPEARVSIGVHPHHAFQFGDDPARAAGVLREQLAIATGVSAIGEIGLDYHYDYSPPEVQRAIFRVQLALARELDRPVVIHTREADDDTLRILREEGGGSLRGVLHCFTGDAALADAGLELGFFISVSGIITFPRAAALRATIDRVPLDRLLVETDCPFLAPVPYRGRRNEPAYVARVVETLAGMRAIDPEEIVRRTTANFHSLFRP
jgi:TatD DNase family protein